MQLRPRERWVPALIEPETVRQQEGRVQPREALGKILKTIAFEWSAAEWRLVIVVLSSRDPGCRTV